MFRRPGIFTVTGKEAPEREPGRSYGLGPLPPTIEPPKTLAENLKTARDVVADRGPYGAPWQAAVNAAIEQVRGPGPSDHPHTESKDIEARVSALVVKGCHPFRRDKNGNPEKYRPIKAQTIAEKLESFGGKPLA